MIFICPGGDKCFSTQPNRRCPMCGNEYRRMDAAAVGLIMNGYSCHEELTADGEEKKPAPEHENGDPEGENKDTWYIKDDEDTITITGDDSWLSPEEAEEQLRRYFESLGDGGIDYS